MSFSLELPRPISLNNMFANVKGRGRVKTKRYNTWTHHAAAMLGDQKPLPRANGPVRILLAVGEVGVSPLLDGDNCLKPILDALVNAGVIPDDNRKVVRGVGMEWVPGKDGVTAHITSAEAPNA